MIQLIKEISRVDGLNFTDDGYKNETMFFSDLIQNSENLSIFTFEKREMHYMGQCKRCA